MGSERDLVRPRFARGVQCFGVRIGAGLAGYGWLSAGPEWIGEIQLEIRPRPGEAYVWNCVTLTEHRRKGIFRSLLLGISQHARRRGLRRLWIGSVAIPAEKGLEPVGFHPVLRFASTRIAGLHVMRVTGSSDVVAVRPGIYVRLSEARRH
jgi:GNAT superfamily N-acetyltransferase